jgi:hypothetical protein
MMSEAYNDAYATCKETSAALRIAHPALDPEAISAQLHLTPSWAWRKGEPKEPRQRPARIGMWALDTDGVVASRDLRRHLDWLLDHLHDKGAILDQLRQQGYAIDVFSTWVRLGGTGGPTLSPRNMRGLADLSLELQFEFWAVDEDEDEDEDASPP